MKDPIQERLERHNDIIDLVKKDEDLKCMRECFKLLIDRILDYYHAPLCPLPATWAEWSKPFAGLYKNVQCYCTQCDHIKEQISRMIANIVNIITWKLAEKSFRDVDTEKVYVAMLLAISEMFEEIDKDKKKLCDKDSDTYCIFKMPVEEGGQDEHAT